MATLVFEISWNPATAAELRQVLDNGVEVAEGPHRDDDNDGRITVQWDSDDLILHTISWELWAGEGTMKELKAVAMWEDGEPKKLKEKDEKAHRWRDRGTI